MNGLEQGYDFDPNDMDYFQFPKIKCTEYTYGLGDKIQCSECPVNTYQDAPASSQCKSCEEGKFAAPGSQFESNCALCGVGKVSRPTDVSIVLWVNSLAVVYVEIVRIPHPVMRGQILLMTVAALKIRSGPVQCVQRVPAVERGVYHRIIVRDAARILPIMPS